MSFPQKDHQSHDRTNDMIARIFHWGHQNVDIVTAMSVASISIVMFAVTLTKLGPYIHSCREKVKEVLTEPAEKTIQLSEAMRFITTGNIQKLTHTVVSQGTDCLHLKSIAGARYKAYVMPGSESSLFNIVSMHVPEYQATASCNLLRSLMFTTFIPFISLTGLQYAVREELDDSVCSSRQSSVISQCIPWFVKSWMRSYTRNDRRIHKSEEPISFADVITPVKEEFYEIVDLINEPQKYFVVGASCPRGVLITGPSGVGKTMLARAMATEANINFISCSASNFVDMYIGRGAKRVRKVFQEARDQAPAILFIDELDALQCRRENDVDQLAGWVASDEYVQTLNQVLHELDSIDGRADNVIVVGATNRPRAIDGALLRSGRFDRCIHMQLPTVSERYDILKVSIKRRGLRLSQYAFPRLQSIAQRTNDWTGAELDSLINEAAFATLRRKAISPRGRGDVSLTTQEDLEEALERVTAFKINKLGHSSSDDHLYSNS